MSKRYQTRRRFLQSSLSAALLGSGIGAMTGKLNLVSSALAASSDYAGLADYKALVCVFLYGGSDSFNMFVPLEQSIYDNYAAARGGLSLSRDNLLASADGVVGFNPDLSALHGYYDQGKLAIVGNVGNLIRPVTREQYLNGNSAIPADLFAHNHQQEQWQKGLASRPTALVGAGWGGRMVDLLASANAANGLPPAFSMAGSNFWQPGNRTTPVAVDPVGGPKLMTYLDRNTGGSRNVARDEAMARILALPRHNLLHEFAGDSFTRARDSSRLLASVLAASPSFNTSYNASSSLATQLRMVARLIAGRQQLGMQRQVFFVGMGGWDTHDNQAVRLHNLSSELNAGLSSFQQSLAELNVEDQVTTFSASDFGRTLTVNGDGSDHGWGGHYLVMGGAVSGGQLIGNWPSYSIGGADDGGDKGRIIPQMSINQYGAALASWMGLSDSDVMDVFPDLANFDTGWQSRYGLFT